MGFYGGVGARRVWSTEGSALGGKQPPAVLVQGGISAQPQNMVDASGWLLTLGIRVDGNYTPGTYLVKIWDKVGNYTYVPFTVRDDTGTKHSLLLQQASTTWQAYNKYGGKSFYTSLAGGSGRFDLREVTAKLRTLHAIEQQIALLWRKVLDQQRGIELEPVMRGGCL